MEFYKDRKKIFWHETLMWWGTATLSYIIFNVLTTISEHTPLYLSPALIFSALGIGVWVHPDKKPLLTIHPNALIINDGYSIPKVGHVLSSDILVITQKFPTLYWLKLNNGKIKYLNTQLLNDGDRKSVDRYLREHFTYINDMGYEVNGKDDKEE